MSTSGDSTVYRRRRHLQFDGARKIWYTTMQSRSHKRPVPEVYPLYRHPDVPEYTYEHPSS